MRIVGRTDDVEKLNRQALRIAREVATNTGTLMAGNLCNTSQYDPNDPKTHEGTRKSFETRFMHCLLDVESEIQEMITWALEEHCDLFIAETFFDYGEASLALECIRNRDPGTKGRVFTTEHTPPQKSMWLCRWQ